MYELKVKNEKELTVARLAIEDYNWSINKYNEQCELLNNKKFKMGDIIVKKGTSYFDNVFGTGNGNIGKIVGWDNEYQYYRVYYCDNNPFVGVNEDDLELYDGEIPLHLIQHKQNEIEGVHVWMS